MSIITLYTMPQVVTVFTAGASSVSTPINRTDFKLFKNVANRIDFLIKTLDKRPALNVANLRIIFSDIDTNKVISSMSMVEIDRLKGHYRLNMPIYETAKFESRAYKYAVTFEDNGDQLVLYADEFKSVIGYVDVEDGVTGNPSFGTEIPNDAFIQTSVGFESMWTASPYKGAAQVNNINGHQSCAVYSEKFTGTFKVFASLDNSPQTDGWFEVACQKLRNFTGVSGLRFTGNHMWLKLEYTPAVINTGEISKVILRVD